MENVVATIDAQIEQLLRARLELTGENMVMMIFEHKKRGPITEAGKAAIARGQRERHRLKKQRQREKKIASSGDAGSKAHSLAP